MHSVRADQRFNDHILHVGVKTRAVI